MKQTKTIVTIVLVVLSALIFKQINQRNIHEKNVKKILRNSTLLHKKPEIDEESTSFNTLINTNNNLDNISKNVLNQLWFTNTQHGLSFETPKMVQELKTSLPQGTEDYYKSLYTYSYSDNDMLIMYYVANTFFETYNTKTGLEGAIKNVINTATKNSSINNSDLELKFTKQNSNTHHCTGILRYKGESVIIRGYCKFNNGRIYSLIGHGFGKNKKVVEEKLDRTFKSISYKG